MKKNALRFLALCMALLTLLGAAGCGNQAKVKKGNDAVTAAQSISARPDPALIPVKYDMEVTLNEEDNTVSGYTDITVKNTTSEAMNEIGLRYFAPAVAKDSKLTAVKDLSANTDCKLKYKVKKTLVIASLAEAVAPNTEKTVRVSFTTAVPKLQDRFGYQETGSGKLYLLTFWAPQLAAYENGKWNDSKYIDYGESTYNRVSEYTMRFTAPAGYTVAASGKQTTEGNVTTVTAPNVREIAVACGSGMEKQSETADGVTFNIYRTYKDMPDEIYDAMFDTAKKAVALYTEKVGPYVFDELDIVPAKLGTLNLGGMEMPGLIIEGLPSGADSSDPELKDILADITKTAAHEVGHQWFCYAVGNDQYNEAWLDEAFTNYLSDYLYCNTPTIDDELAEDKENRYYINLPFNKYKNEDHYQYCIYNIGAQFLHLLENQMGSDKFFEMLQDWYSANQLKVVHGADFVNHVLKYDDSEGVKNILNRYLHEDYL